MNFLKSVTNEIWFPMVLCPNPFKTTLPALQLLFPWYPPLSKQQYLWWVTWGCRCAPRPDHSLLLHRSFCLFSGRGNNSGISSIWFLTFLHNSHNNLSFRFPSLLDLLDYKVIWRRSTDRQAWWSKPYFLGKIRLKNENVRSKAENDWFPYTLLSKKLLRRIVT